MLTKMDVAERKAVAYFSVSCLVKVIKKQKIVDKWVLIVEFMHCIKEKNKC